MHSHFTPISSSAASVNTPTWTMLHKRNGSIVVTTEEVPQGILASSADGRFCVFEILDPKSTVIYMGTDFSISDKGI